MDVSVRELKNRLCEYLRRVQAGESITVTRRGRPVACLSALSSPDEQDLEGTVIARLDAQPWVRPGQGGKLMGAEKPIPWKPGQQMLSDLVVEERE